MGQTVLHGKKARSIEVRGKPRRETKEDNIWLDNIGGQRGPSEIRNNRKQAQIRPDWRKWTRYVDQHSSEKTKSRRRLRTDCPFLHEILQIVRKAFFQVQNKITYK